MKITILTIFPEMFKSIFKFGIIGQGIKKGLIDISIKDLRLYTLDKHKQVDDRPFGGGTGMVLMLEPLVKAIESHKEQNGQVSKVLYLSPKGQTLSQNRAEILSLEKDLILVCGRYEGVDQRFIDNYVDEEISIGDYVLSGGEIPAMVLVDTVARLVKGVISNADFNDNESFSDPNDRHTLDFPQYTRPADFRGLKVPEVLLSGNHEAIKKWRLSLKNVKTSGILR